MAEFFTDFDGGEQNIQILRAAWDRSGLEGTPETEYSTNYLVGDCPVCYGIVREHPEPFDIHVTHCRIAWTAEERAFLGERVECPWCGFVMSRLSHLLRTPHDCTPRPTPVLGQEDAVIESADDHPTAPAPIAGGSGETECPGSLSPVSDELEAAVLADPEPEGREWPCPHCGAAVPMFYSEDRGWVCPERHADPTIAEVAKLRAIAGGSGEEMVKTREDIYQAGYQDGYTAAEESGTAEAPVDGWDGWTINAIGRQAFLVLLGLGDRTEWMDDPDVEQAALTYAEGAQAGADAAIAALSEAETEETTNA